MFTGVSFLHTDDGRRVPGTRRPSWGSTRGPGVSSRYADSIDCYGLKPTKRALLQGDITHRSFRLRATQPEDVPSDAGVARGPLLGEGGRPLLGVLRPEHRQHQLGLLGPRLGTRPVARLAGHLLADRDRQRSVGGDRRGEREGAV